MFRPHARNRRDQQLGLRFHVNADELRDVCRLLSPTAMGISADFSRYTGVLPAPTPSAGLPELYAAFTAPGPPVASIRPMSLCRIRYLLSSSVCPCRQVNTPSGAPHFTAVSYMVLTAS